MMIFFRPANPVQETTSNLHRSATKAPGSNITKIRKANFGTDDSAERQLGEAELRDRPIHDLLSRQRRRQDLELQLQDLNRRLK